MNFLHILQKRFLVNLEKHSLNQQQTMSDSKEQKEEKTPEEEKHNDITTPDSDMPTVSPYHTPETVIMDETTRNALSDELVLGMLEVINDDDPSAECMRDARYHSESINWLIAHYDPQLWGTHWESIEYKLRANLQIHLHELICFCMFKKSSREIRRDTLQDD